jgi:hypothetical protein
MHQEGRISAIVCRAVQSLDRNEPQVAKLMQQQKATDSVNGAVFR